MPTANKRRDNGARTVTTLRVLARLIAKSAATKAERKEAEFWLKAFRMMQA